MRLYAVQNGKRGSASGAAFFLAEWGRLRKLLYKPLKIQKSEFTKAAKKAILRQHYIILCVGLRAGLAANVSRVTLDLCFG
jgi:hypothetical protein